jgi:hypothetical protein
VGLQVQVQQHQPQGGIAVLFLNIFIYPSDSQQ